jgi:DNA polymerase-4
VEYHHKLIRAVDSCVPVERVLSIDEMACQLTGSQQQQEKAVALASQIKETIARDVGTELKCSIGIAPNLYLSKTASDMQKPNGCVVIEESDLPDCLFRLDLNDLSGIGRNMKPRLERHGIFTVKDLCTVDKASLRKAWGGIEGERMHARLRGEIVYDPPTHRSSIGHSHVLPPAQRTDDTACAVLNRLLQKAAMRLRKYGLVTGAMHISIRYLSNTRWGDEVTFNATQDTMELLKAFTTLWGRRSYVPSPPLMVGVTLTRLGEEQHRTLSLFGGEMKSTSFNKAIDKLNERYGKNTIYFGGAQPALEAAPMRIAFTHIPDYS